MDKEQSGEQRGAPQAPPEKSPGSDRASLQQEDPSEQLSHSSQQTVTQHAAPFSPREFYLRSSAVRRYSRQRQPLAISSGAGTSRSLLLTSPPLRRWRPWDPSVAPKSPKKSESPPPKFLKPLEGPRGRQYTGKQELLFLQEFPVGPKRHSSSISSMDSDLTSILLQKQVLSHFPRWSSTPSVEPLGDRSLSFLRTESQLGSSQEHRYSARASSLVMPTSVEEVIASLHSEAQLAADQHFKELVRSILGPTCDLESDVEVGESNRKERSSVLEQCIFSVRLERC